MQFRFTHLPLKMNLAYPNLPSAYVARYKLHNISQRDINNAKLHEFFSFNFIWFFFLYKERVYQFPIKLMSIN